MVQQEYALKHEGLISSSAVRVNLTERGKVVLSTLEVACKVYIHHDYSTNNTLSNSKYQTIQI